MAEFNDTKGPEKPTSDATITLERSNTVGESAAVDAATLDDAILRAQGHAAAMPRSFTKLDALGFGFR